MAQSGWLAAPPGRRGRQGQRLSEQPFAQNREEGEQAGVFQHAAAQGVDHRDRTQPARFDQARHAQVRIRAQLEGVAVPRVDPSEDDVDRFGMADGPHPDPAVLHPQIRALDELVAELGGQRSVLEGGLAPRAGRQNHDPGLGRGLGGDRLQAGAQSAEKGASRCTWASLYKLGKTRESTERLAAAYAAPDGAWVRSESTQRRPSRSRAMSTP